MGFFLSSLQPEFSSLQSQLARWVEPLDRVKDYHGIFKSVCDTFVIRKDQFSLIFGSEDKLGLWENSETVNALEVFCGLIYYSSGDNFKLKLKFLFALFDFNEIKSISIVDLEYMILSILNFTYKVLGKVNTKADELKLVDWIVKFMNPRKRIGINKLYTFCCNSVEVREFLLITGNVIPLCETGDKFYNQQDELDQDERDTLLTARFEAEINAKIAWFSNFSQKLTKPKYKKEVISKTSLNWAYGIELQRLNRPFSILSQQAILYAISSKLIVYQTECNSQSIYTGHEREVECFTVQKQQHLVASAEGQRNSKIHIWDYESLQTRHIIIIDHTHKIHLMTFSMGENLLAAVGDREESPVLYFDSMKEFSLKASFAMPQKIVDIIPLHSPLHLSDVPNALANFFAFSSAKSVFVVDSNYGQHRFSFNSPITTMALSYLNSQQPHLRYLNNLAHRIYLITGHANGSLSVLTLLQRLRGSMTELIEHERWQLLSFEEPIQQLLVASQALYIMLGNQIRVYEIDIMAVHEDRQAECENFRLIRPGDLQYLRLISCELRFLDVSQSQIAVITQEGDMLLISDREVDFDGSFHQQEVVKRLGSIVKLGGKMKALCFAERDSHGVLMVVSEQRKIFQIDPQSHQVMLVLEVSLDDEVTVIDSAVSEEGVGYTICGCRSGKLLVRSDWEEVARVYDCLCEITDLKISNDCSYLLVATLSSLMFFQLAPTFSSPRKVTFENQSPVSLNFLDNLRFCAVGTSAKNVYLIEIPQLRHRNIQKQNQCFSITKMALDFPNHSEESGRPIYTRCYIGGDMKFYLLSLTSGQLLYFPSMESLPNKNYLLLRAHNCPIANIAVAEDQTRFFTLGRSDCMLLQWIVQEQRPSFSVKKMEKKVSIKKEQDFERVKEISQSFSKTDKNFGSCTFYFRGTKSDKLNLRLHEGLNLATENCSEEETALIKRHCNTTLQTRSVYGMSCDKNNQIRYLSPKSQDSRFLYSSSRFLIEGSEKGEFNRISEHSAKKIAYFDLSSVEQLVYAETGSNPRIFVDGVVTVWTTHKRGLIHFSIFQDFILSFGISEENYSLNLHNFRTGQLLAERTTFYQISSFLPLSEHEFISLNQVCRWHKFVTSDPIGFATAGVLMPNGRDVCLGGAKGQLSVLSEDGLFEVANNAHSKEVILMRVNIKVKTFELITAGLDETVKIWSEFFEQLLIINLNITDEFTILREQEGIPPSDSKTRVSRFVVNSLDCKPGKILLALTIGQVWEFTVSTKEERVQENHGIHSQVSLSSESDCSDGNLYTNLQKMQVSYNVERHKLLDAHCSQIWDESQRYVTFDVHGSLPLLGTAGNDGRIIFRDYLREVVVGNYFCERQLRIRVLRFSPKGRMLVAGLSNGSVMTFYLEVAFDDKNHLNAVILRRFQTFRVTQVQGKLDILAIEFNSQSDHFAVSYLQDPSAAVRKSNQLLHDCQAFVRVYRLKTERNQNSDEAFYQYRDEIKVKDDEKTGKVSKCVTQMQFQSQMDKNYIFLSQQFVDFKGRKVSSARAKYSVYCMEDHALLPDEFTIDWTHANFPSLVNLRMHDPNTDELSEDYQITCMLRSDSTLYYGGFDGKLHLVRVESLDIYGGIKEYKLTDMCLSRCYDSHTSAIVALRVANCEGRRFLFTSGQSDECVIKFELIAEDSSYFLEHQAYPLEPGRENELAILRNQILSRDSFFLMINNRQPLREQLSNILQDVEPRQNAGLRFEVAKVFGRRASDRRYNLCFFQGKALYSLGPNMVIQDLKNSAIQQLMAIDPSPSSHRPQISAFHYDEAYLIIAAEEERSSCYIWDIKSKSCISSMHVECSFITMLRLTGSNCAVFYGVNDKFQLVVGLIDWRARKTIGSVRLAYSGNWTIRDIASASLTDEPSQFVTCGHLHLCHWEMRGSNLTYRNFNSQSDGFYVSVRCFNKYVATGSEQGHLYLWRDFQLIHKLEDLHTAAVWCLQVDLSNQLFISGGKDGVIFFLKIQESKLCPINRVGLRRSMKGQQQQLGQPEDEIRPLEVEYEIQSLCSNPQMVSEQYETLLVGTRSGNIYEIRYNQCNQETLQHYQNRDNEAIASVTFSTYDKDCFYVLTNTGVIQRWQIGTLSKIKSFELGQRASKIQACKEYLLICCSKQLLVYLINISENNLSKVDNLCIDTRLSESQGNQNKQSEIVRFCLSKNDRTLALCLKTGSKEPSYIINIYEFGRTECIYQLNNLKHEIDYLDFSTDDKYMLFKDKYEEIGMINLEKDFRRINTIFVEMAIEWQQEGLRISPKAQNIYYSYSCENKITAITRLGHDKIVVGDEMGTIRIFDYPCPDDKLGELHLECYTDHMNDISNIAVHPNLQYVLTSGLQDRALILWRIVKAE